MEQERERGLRIGRWDVGQRDELLQHACYLLHIDVEYIGKLFGRAARSPWRWLPLDELRMVQQRDDHVRHAGE